MINIDGKTKTLGLIGNPVEHTMSPFIQNLFAEQMGINMVYVPFHVENGRLEDAIKGAKALNLTGNNITVPYKVEVLPHIDVLDQKAEIIEAVNTIKYSGDQVFGYNTDAEGFLMSCQREGISFEDKEVCILGAGGASKAVAVVCAQQKAKKLILVNRTIEKAYALKKSIQKYFDIEIDVQDYTDLLKLDVVHICIQTTSIGMYPNIHESPIVDKTFFNKLEWAIDAIYNPSETMFLSLARENGVKSLNGLSMLYFQAVKAFQIWNDVIIPQPIIEKCFKLFNDYIYSR
ncbi:MAG: shikimate dehydrogenase [Firmicutes bacterium HGW-Firmicutes-1]|jgi:shikimate dehydrogenase|nr:MAG: shikimate dehydrogenase [Firmicutes bacterium HGW-Firmicutes-1]